MVIKFKIKYGYFKEGQKAVTMKGAEGAVQIAKMMDDLRNNPPKKFGAWNVVEFKDINHLIP